MWSSQDEALEHNRTDMATPRPCNGDDWPACLELMACSPRYAEFSTGASVGLSNITILGGAISNLLFNAPRRHSMKHAPLIDWDLIMVMEPLTILGTILGGYLNKVCLVPHSPRNHELAGCWVRILFQAIWFPTQLGIHELAGRWVRILTQVTICRTFQAM